MKRTLLALLLCLSGIAVAAEMSPTLPNILAGAKETDQIAVIAYLDHRLTMDDVYPEAKALPMGLRREYVVRVLKQRFAEMSPNVMAYLNGAATTGGVTLLRELWILNAIRVTARPAVIEQLSKAFPEVIYVVHDPIYENTLDEIGWGVFESAAPQVWEAYNARGQGVLVGHKDSGVNFDGCSKFDGRIWFNPGEDLNGNGSLDAGEDNGIDDDHNRYVDDFFGWNFDDNDNDVSGDEASYHGTRTASIICSNTTGICDTVTMAPLAKLIVLSGYKSQGSVMESSQYAVENGVNVISASLSFKQEECDDGSIRECPNRVAFRWTVEMELAAGIIHANSTGNNGCSGDPRPLCVGAPADCPPPAMTDAQFQEGGVSSIVSVAAYNANGNYDQTSRRGPCAWSEQDICVHARTPWCGPDGSLTQYPAEFNDYPYHNGAHGLFKPDITAPTIGAAISGFCTCTSINGTSGATPHVGGALALIYSAFPGITPEDAYLALVNGALDAGDAGPDTTWGFGKLRMPPAIGHADDELGSVAGTVSASQGGQPLANVRVTVEGANPVWTNASGQYELFLLPGTYTGDFEKYGYQTVSRNINIVAGQVDDGNLTLGAAGNASVTLTVVEEDGSWMPNILVRHPLSDTDIFTDGDGQVVFDPMFDGVQEFEVAGNVEVYEHTVHRIQLDQGANAAQITLTPAVQFGPTGPDAYGYFAYDDVDDGGPEFDFVDITTGLGTNLNLSGDNSVVQELPFTMQFYGQTATNICIGANGNATVGSACNNDWGRWPIPSPNSPNNYIAVFYQDYRPEGGGGVWYYDDQENGRVIVQWDDVPEYFGFGRATFELMIYNPDVMHDHLGNSIIEVHFLAYSGRFDGTTGIENSDGTDGLQYTHNQYYSQGATPVRAGRAIRFTTDLIEPVGDGPVTVADEFRLLQNYPNPFNSQTTFRFSVPQQSQVALRLFDITGREAATVFDGIRQAGEQSVTFDATGLATGIYFARLEAQGRVVGARKVLFLK